MSILANNLMKYYWMQQQGGGGGDLDYFYIEALEDDSTISAVNFDASYNLSSSYDKTTWTALTGSTIATGVNSGTKIYFAGDTTTLGSTYTVRGCSLVSDKEFSSGGKIFSLYSHNLIPKTLTNRNDINFMFDSSKIKSCSVNFEPLSTAYGLFNNCSNLSEISDKFNISNPVQTIYMFYKCSKLSGLPDGFNCPSSVISTQRMFERCSSLTGLPDGFNCPNVTNGNGMFLNCNKLTSLPVGFSCPNLTDADFMFSDCTSLSALPDGFTFLKIRSNNQMFIRCNSLTTIGNNVKIIGYESTMNEATYMPYSQITSIGDNFEWFTNIAYSGTWDPALGIRNVFPNATSVGSGWKVYDHYDGE